MTLIQLVEKALPAKRINIFAKEGLLMTSFPYYLLAVIIAMAFFLIFSNAWAFVFIIYALLPFADEIFTRDTRNPTEQQKIHLQSNDIFFRICLYITMILDWTIFFSILRYFNQFEFTFWNCYNLAALFFIFIHFNAVQFVVAHEIFHKPGLFNKVLGTLQISKNLYIHFTYEHLFGHHRRVATPEDPASAQQGSSIYQFFPQTFCGSYKSVYNMQKEEKKPFFLNLAVLSIAGALAFTFGIYYFYNFQTTIFFILEAFLSIFYLETINYIEHYGLSRQKLANGEYQKVTIRHSWNAPHRVSSYVLFKLQRHSDHHENSLKPYQTLLSLDQSPHLPHGYSLIIFLSFFPSQWHKIMDPLVDDYKKLGVGTVKNEITQNANMLTRKFGIKLGLTVTILWIISYLRFL